MTDENLMREARRRVKAKRGFRDHVITYICVNAFLVIIYFVTGRGGTFWPLWPLAGWGFALLMHGLTVFTRLFGKSTEEAVQAEYQRLKGSLHTD